LLCAFAMAHAIASSQQLGLPAVVESTTPARLERLVRQLLVCEADTDVRCASVASREPDPIRALAMRRAASHAERTLWALPIAVRDEALLREPSATESAWRSIREHFAGLLGVGHRYRRALPALDRGLVLMRQIAEIAVIEGRFDLWTYAARWLDERAPLVTDARAALETHTLVG